MKKVILITGSTSGIGLATSLRLIDEGHIVYASTRSEESKKKVEDAGGIPVRIEMEDESTMQEVVDKIIQEQGRIDVLFNNAGWSHFGPIEEVPMETARHIFEVNLFGLAELTRLVFPHMRKQGEGLIINNSSMGGKIYTPLGAWYHASKHALEGWSDCLRIELKPHNIKVSIVEPGIIETGFNEAMLLRIKNLESTGAYENMKKSMIQSAENGIDGSSAEVIAEVVSKIIRSDKPKVRYRAGKKAHLAILSRKYLGDNFFDWFVSQQVKKYKKN